MMATPSRVIGMARGSSSIALSTLNCYPQYHHSNYRYGSSSTSSSQRQRRRRYQQYNKRATTVDSSQQQQQQQQQQQGNNNTNNAATSTVIHKKPWWRYITIWPDPHGYDPVWEAQQRYPWPKSYKHFEATMRKSIALYRYSHEGWLLPERTKESDNKNDDNDNDNEESVSGMMEDSKKEISANVSRNVDFLAKEGAELKTIVQQETGIATMEDLQAWAGRQMKLATECLQTFMEGYRQGRDEEVERMLNTNDYNLFPSITTTDDDNDDESKGKRRRRKPKRRIRTAD